MSEEYPVTVAVRRRDGSIEQVRVGTAVRAGEGFRLTLGELTIAEPVPAVPRGASANADGPVFPPYGRSKGAPVAGASMQDLEYYASGCRRTLNDPNKARWHDKERQLLAAIEAEIARQGGSVSGGGGGGSYGGGGGGYARREAPPSYDDAPPRVDEDIPF